MFAASPWCAAPKARKLPRRLCARFPFYHLSLPYLIAEAYDILSDPEKRETYDHAGEEAADAGAL